MGYKVVIIKNFNFVKCSFLLLGLIFCTSLNSLAQRYLGLAVAGNFNKISHSQSDDSKISIIPKLGINYSIAYKDDLNDYLTVVTQAGLYKKNYRKQSNIDDRVFEDFYNQYIQTTIGLRISLFNHLHQLPYFEVSPYTAYWISSKEKGMLPSTFNNIETGVGLQSTVVAIEQKHEFDAVRDRRWDAGLNFGIGKSFIWRDSEINVGIYWSQSFLSQQKWNQLEQEKKINNSFNLQFTYAIKI